jgi:SAM-dependent methyltransferase
MQAHDIIRRVKEYYADKLRTHGALPRGVDWNSVEAQVLRFEQLLKIRDTEGPFSINDYGCGYGALVEWMSARGFAFQYRGFDISDEMIAHARRLHEGNENCKFCAREADLREADYTVASGVLNVKLDASHDDWGRYVLDTVGRMAAISKRGFAFNALTKYSDPERTRPDLYYADPCFLFDYCKRNFSKYVALLHDYPLYDFTILVRK